ncbi:MAG: hypothetical protein GXO27_00845 [Chlorobi bacterium]|nr:hypothetical protein [Chlorobiota bacterium]
MKKYPAFIIIAHWLTAVLLVINALLGFQLEEVAEHEGITPETFGYFRTHALIGAAILVITLIRWFVKFKNRDRLPELEYYGDWHKKLVNGIHALIYLLLILVPLTGIINMYQAGVFGVCFGKPFPEEVYLSESLTEIHETLVKLLFALVAAHVAGVISYILKTKENILKRMCLLAK